MRRALLSALLVLLAGAGVGAAAGAGATTRTVAPLTYTTQDTFRHVLWVQGHALDRAHPTRSIGVRVYVDGHYRAHAVAKVASPVWDRTNHVRGAHGYRVALAYAARAARVSVVPDGARTAVAARTVRHVWPSAGTRIAWVAARYVGHARYREGGASPRTGFDCSGYTRYAYLAAHVRTLPHYAESQRHVRGMHRVPAAAARPGDLVFYLSGGRAYHVAVYAGHHTQYAAATPRDGIRHQRIWSSHVEYRTITH